MAGEWREYRIGQIAEIVGGSTPSTDDPSNFDGDIPWLTPKDLSGQHDRYVSRGERNLSRKGLENCSARLLPAGTVLLTTRAPIGYVAIAKNPVATNQGFRNLVPKPGISSEFLYYWLKAHVEELRRHANGSTFQELTGTTLANIKIRIPSLAEQRAIAHILGTLDDKIELNRRMSETLEGMARAIFKAWFVDFEPVRAKMEGRWRRGESLPGLPAHLYDLFPDQLVDSGLGEIPEGWRVGKLGDVAENWRRSVEPENIHPDTAYIGLEHMPRRSIALFTWGAASEIESNKFEFRQGDILFGKLRPYFHKVGLAPVDGVCSTDILVVRPKRTPWLGFVLGHLSSTEFVEYTSAGSSGTRMPRTNWADMARYEFALPPETVAESFTRLVQPLIGQIFSNIHESRTLAAVRDALLPKLIRGEVRVKDAERFLKERGL
jgi:type I restriction enzyme S subunit